ncbi:MAG: WavE lipopolysaccharide synthesis family protein [Shewanella sp.]|nr:WavE lipopolysaccharide synthesis family protein [Shewanella sp.]MCF1431869.1 WavE lipopolysaccharide synthesis family protein [Shewanella sp.]MCF1438055.1 WavE lipopolysaccharide synthesis family protein [Shewanella sp.]MCF1457467.1 WavE lipopolysaccharide synthesis family protein [Shewanella sp.]
MQQYSDISVVIHGPVNSLPERDMEQGITLMAINSVRQHLPGAKIILSTWEGQNVADLDVDEVVLNQDPGPNIMGYYPDGTPYKENNNRQIVAVKEGLKRVNTSYAVKLRSDNYLLHSGFVGLQQAFPKRCEALKLLNERVVVLHRFTKMQTAGRRIVRHLCDLFAYGRTKDLLKMWDIPLQSDYPYNPDIKGKSQYAYFPERVLSTEQLFCSKWLTKLNPDSRMLNFHHDCDESLLREWQLLLANNLIIAEANNAGVATTARLKADKSRANEISSAEWQVLYQKYCDTSYYQPKQRFWLETGLYRALKAPFELIKQSLKKRKPLNN